MQVRELIQLLQTMPQDDCVMLWSNHASMATSVIAVSQHGLGHVSIRDFNLVRQPKIVRAFDGIEYEVPWT